MSAEYSVELDGGKYTVRHTSGGNFHALRYGEPWRDLTGDGLILSLVQRIEELEAGRIEADERAVPVLHIRCEVQAESIIAGSTYLNVVRVEREDDGSFTAVTDHWPNPPAQAAQVEPGEQAAEWFMHEFSDLNAATACLVWNFALALGNKLAAAEKKYGYTDGWRSPAWMDECRTKLMEHIRKGDPRDVAAYCAFLWHHGASTAPTANPPNHPHSPDAADSVRVDDAMVYRFHQANRAKCAEIGSQEPMSTEAIRAGLIAALAAHGQGDAVANDEIHPTNRSLFAFMCHHIGIELGKDTIAEAYRKGMERLNINPHPSLPAPPAPPASPAGVPDGWIPIESAPNDGTPHVRGLHVFSSTDGAYLYWDAVVGRIDTEDGQFYDLGGDLSGWAADDFTHWHALAAAPSAPEGGEVGL